MIAFKFLISVCAEHLPWVAETSRCAEYNYSPEEIIRFEKEVYAQGDKVLTNNNKMNKLKNNLTILGTFLSGVVGHHYIGKILDYKSEMAASKEIELRAISESENIEIMQNKLINMFQNHNCHMLMNC
jgi:hypothetical protein